MSAPFAPVVNGPITELSTQVYVDNVLPNSVVTVYNDPKGIPKPTNLVGTATSTAPGAIWVPLTKKLSAGEIMAQQEYTGKGDTMILVTGTSEPSDEVPVQPVPDPLPAPSYSSGLSQCMDSVLMSRLIPGAHLKISLAGKTLFDGHVTTPVQWVRLKGTGPLAVGGSLEAVQSASGYTPSRGVPSGPIQAAPTHLAAPILDPIPAACQTTFNVSNVTPGADLKLTVVGGAKLDFISTANPCDLGPTIPLPVGPLTAQQYFTRCENIPPGPTAKFTIKKQAPSFPIVNYQPCADVKQLTVTSLTGGEILTLQVNYETEAGKNTTVLLGQQGVSGDSATVPLPNGWYPTDAAGPVTLWISASLCDTALPTPPGHTAVAVVQEKGPFSAPTVGPLYQCANFVTLTGAHLGSVVQIFSGAPTTPAVPRSNAVVAISDPMTVNLWTPVIAGELIFATQQGCNALSPSPRVRVLPIPMPFLAPQIVQPVRPGATTVNLSGVLPGALVNLLVNGTVVQMQYANTSSMSLSTSTPLNENTVLEVFQTLCPGMQSEHATQTVMIGPLVAEWADQPPLLRGESNSFTIFAVDGDTHTPVKGLPLTISVGFTGTTPTGPSSSGLTYGTIHYTPSADDKTAVALVIGAPGYRNAELKGIPLEDPLKVWAENTLGYGAKVYGTGFASRFGTNFCEVTLTDEEPFGSTQTFGPWSGDIVEGISVTLECTGSPGQYFNFSVQAFLGGNPSGMAVQGGRIYCPSMP